MDITTQGVASSYGPQDFGHNLTALKADLRRNLDKTRHILTEITENPDHLNTQVSDTLTTSLLNLHKLASQAASLKDNSALSSTLKDNAQIILNILEAPVYV